jgi:hypothetical protein
MDAPETPPATPTAVLARVARAPATRAATAIWWVGTGGFAALAYLSAAAERGVGAPVGGTLFIVAMCMVAVVARNASAEAHLPGSVQRGSLLRAALFGVVLHGGLLAAVTILAGGAFVAAAWVTGGAALVALTRPSTLVALGAATAAAEASAPDGRSQDPGHPSAGVLSVPAIIAELRATAEQVRETSDPVRKALLAERRGELLESLAERDPQAFASLLDEPAPRNAGESPDGPRPS